MATISISIIPKDVFERGIIRMTEGGIVTMPDKDVWMTVDEIADMLFVSSAIVFRTIRSIYNKGIGSKANGIDKRKASVNSVRFKGGFLCSPEHSKVCFLLHETPFAAQNSLLCRGLWLTSEVGLPVHTCRKQ